MLSNKNNILILGYVWGFCFNLLDMKIQKKENPLMSGR